MLFAILLSAASTVATPPATATPSVRKCENPRLTLAGGADRPLINPLGEAPPARQILAVMRTDFDGCVRPVAARSSIRKR